MNQWIAIVKTAADEPLWGGLPPEYPVSCQEFNTVAEAEACPGVKRVMLLTEYRALTVRLHAEHPAPAFWQERPELRWYQFWRRWL